MEEKNLIVTEQEQGKRLDVYLTSALDISRSYAQQLIQRQGVTVNGKDAKANRRLNEGDQVKAVIEVQEEYKVVPQDIPLDIVYEDKDIIVINKARGMVVHPAAGNPDGTLVNALLYHCQGELSGINGVIRPGIVHRLDKDTSGVMVAAKTDEAHKGLAEQIKAHSAHRTYWALVHGNISEERGIVDAPIGRHPKDRIKMAVTFKGGREAVTHFKVLKRYGDLPGSNVNWKRAGLIRSASTWLISIIPSSMIPYMATRRMISPSKARPFIRTASTWSIPLRGRPCILKRRHRLISWPASNGRKRKTDRW